MGGRYRPKDRPAGSSTIASASPSGSSDFGTITGTTKPKPWVVPEQAIDTPWVSVPGLLTAKCSSNDNASGYLEVTVNGNPADPRTDDIVGDIGAAPNVLANWGLHLIDVNLVMGNLLDVVGRQVKTYTAKKGSR